MRPADPGDGEDGKEKTEVEMTDAKSEGPYKINFEDGYVEFFGVPKLSREGLTFHDAPEAVVFHLNNSYAEGRKAMEKEFKELLELANWMEEVYPGRFENVGRFKAWKKARGLE